MTSAPRRWLEVSVEAPADEDTAALLVEELLALGCRGAHETGGRLVAHLAEPADPQSVRARLASSGGSALDVTFRWIDHEDWAETWKAGFGPRRVTDRLVVSPPWAVPALDEGAALVVIDPGVAFGTAEHGTTRGCLRLLDGVVSVGDRVVDVGAGSGVLSIAAAKLSASAVVAIEADALAYGALVDNVAANGVDAVITCVQEAADAERLGSLGLVDGIVANIETGTLRALAPGFAEALRDGGWLIVSGVPDDEWAALGSEIEAVGFARVQVDADGGWRTGLFRRRR